MSIPQPNTWERRIITILLAALVGVILFFSYQRLIHIEPKNRSVELALPEGFLIRHTTAHPDAPKVLLQAGVTTLVRKPYTLQDLIKYKLAQAWHVEPDLMEIQLKDNELTGNATIFLTGQLGMAAVSMRLQEDSYVFDVRLPGPVEEIDPGRFIFEISTGPMPNGYRRALLLPAGDWGKTTDLDQFTQRIYSLKPDIVIPDWQGGYNAASFFRSYLKTAWLRKPWVALPEFSMPWQGKWIFRQQTTHHMIRVHLIKSDLFSHYSQARIVNRLVRAAKERQIGLLYIEPPDNWVYAEVIQFVSKVKQALNQQGLSLGKATLPKLIRPGSMAFFMIYSGLGAMLFLLIWKIAIWAVGVTGRDRAVDQQLTLRLKPKIFRWIAFFTAIGFMIIHWQGKITWSTKAAALTIAVLTPLLSLAHVSQGQHNQSDYWSAWSLALKDFIRLSLWNIMAGLTIATLLYQPAFVLKLDSFLGVKVSFILPLFLIGIYLFPSITDWYWWKKRFVKANRWRTLIGLLMIVCISAILIIRSGNYSWLPVVEWEWLFREKMENFFGGRPRFKEFMIGHPLLFIGLAGRRLISSGTAIWPDVCLAIGMVGQISMINTFCHLHTPFALSLMRTTHGLWVGLLLASVCLAMIMYHMNRKKTK